MTREKNFAGFLNETFEVIGGNIVAVVVFVLVIGGLTSAATLFGFIGAQESFDVLGTQLTTDFPVIGGLLSIYAALIVVVSVLASYFLLSTMLESRGMLPNAGTRIWAYIGISILSALGTGLGFLLLIVPGIIVMVRWSAAPSFLLSERGGIVQSLGDSWEATRGSGWPIFFAGLVLFIGFAVVAGIVGAFGGMVNVDPVSTSFSSMFDALGNAITIAFGVAVFSLVHDSSEAVGEVFS